MQDFCTHNKKYKLYYLLLNKTDIVNKLLEKLILVKHPIIKNKILHMIKNNHKVILHNIKLLKIVISFYIKNDLINKSDIGKLFKFYLKNINKININNHKSLLKLFYKIIEYPHIVSVLKEIFYIFSDYRSCLYYMTPSINFYNCKKDVIKDVVIKFRDNINTLTQIISKVYIGDKNYWGSPYYSTAFSMFQTLIILKKYFKDPLNLLHIQFKVLKKCNESNIIKNICENYHIQKIKESNIDDKLNEKYINNVSQFILNIKRLGYDMWYVIPLVFNSIFESYEISGLTDAKILNHNKLYFQKTNNYLGLMCYLLADYGYITNTNLFQNFND
jgi:hypothetical protein